MSTPNENDKPVWAMSVVEKRAKAHSLEVSKLLAGSLKELSSVLGSEDSARRFARIATQASISNSDLMECSPASVVQVLMHCASIDLEPNTPLAEAFVIPYAKQATLQIGRNGWIRIASRTGLIKVARGVAVYEREIVEGLFEWDESTEPATVRHKRYTGSEPMGAVAYAYSKVLLNDGTLIRELALRHQIDGARKKAAARSKAWMESEDRMAEKYALKRTLSTTFGHLDKIRDAVRVESPEPVTIDVSPAKVARLAPAAQDRVPEIGPPTDLAEEPADPEPPSVRQTIDVVADPPASKGALATVAQRAPIAAAVKTHLGGNRERALEIAHELWDIERWDQITAEQVAPLVAAIEAEGAAAAVKGVIDEARSVGGAK